MRRFVVFLIVLAIVTVWISKSASTANTTLVAVGSQWKYLDNGSNQGTAWRAVGFADGGWAAGNAQLGYGDGDEATTVGYGPDPNNKYVTTRGARAQAPRRTSSVRIRRTTTRAPVRGSTWARPDR